MHCLAQHTFKLLFRRESEAREKFIKNIPTSLKRYWSHIRTVCISLNYSSAFRTLIKITPTLVNELFTWVFLFLVIERMAYVYSIQSDWKRTFSFQVTKFYNWISAALPERNRPIIVLRGLQFRTLSINRIKNLVHLFSISLISFYLAIDTF